MGNQDIWKNSVELIACFTKHSMDQDPVIRSIAMTPDAGTIISKRKILTTTRATKLRFIGTKIVYTFIFVVDETVVMYYEHGLILLKVVFKES